MNIEMHFGSFVPTSSKEPLRLRLSSKNLMAT